MVKALAGHSRSQWHPTDARLARGVAWGAAGGFAGTFVMDLILMGALSVAGLPALTCFSVIGDTVARFLSNLGLELAGSVALGAAAQFLLGSAIGASFGAAAARVAILRVNTRKRGIVLAVLFVEMAGQPLLASMVILLKWTLPEILVWYGGALFAHFIAGTVLGLVTGYGTMTESGRGKE